MHHVNSVHWVGAQTHIRCALYAATANAHYQFVVLSNRSDHRSQTSTENSADNIWLIQQACSSCSIYTQNTSWLNPGPDLDSFWSPLKYKCLDHFPLVDKISSKSVLNFLSRDGSRGCPGCPDTRHFDYGALFESFTVNKYHVECIKTHHFDIRNTEIFCGGGTAPSGLKKR